MRKMRGNRRGIECALFGVLAIAGCRPTFEGRAQYYERLSPTTQLLAAGDFSEVDRAERELEELMGLVVLTNLDQAGQEAVMERLRRARRALRLRVARSGVNPNQSCRYIFPELPTADAEVLAAMRACVDAAFAQRQADYSGTYRVSVRNIVESESLSVHGNASYHHRSIRDEGTIGNCVFAGAPFPPEGQPNPALTARITSETETIYARCYSEQDLSASPSGTRYFAVFPGEYDTYTVEAGQADGLAPGTTHLDFVLTRGPGVFERIQLDAAFVPIELTAVWARDNRIVLVDGALRVRPDWRTRLLARGGVIWDRHGGPAELALAQASQPVAQVAEPTVELECARAARDHVLRIEHARILLETRAGDVVPLTLGADPALAVETALRAIARRERRRHPTVLVVADAGIPSAALDSIVRAVERSGGQAEVCSRPHRG